MTDSTFYDIIMIKDSFPYFFLFQQLPNGVGASLVFFSGRPMKSALES